MAGKKPARGMMELKKELDEGVVRQLYLLYGSERYLLREYKKRLLERYVAEGDSFNFTAYAGDQIKVPELLDTIRTMPFLAEHRVVLVEGSGFFQKPNEELMEGLSEMSESTILIFVEPDVEKSSGITKGVDKRLRMYKIFEKAEGDFCFDTPSPDMLVTWVTGLLGKSGLPLEKGVPERLISAVGNDMQNLENETEKLISYTIGKDGIRKSDVEEICVSQVEEKVFDMIDAISGKDKPKAIRLYNDLLYLREPPVYLIHLIRKHYLQLLSVKEMVFEKKENSAIAKTAGVMPFLVKKYIAQAEKYEAEILRTACGYCLDTMSYITSGALSDQNALEQLIIKLLSL